MEKKSTLDNLHEIASVYRNVWVISREKKLDAQELQIYRNQLKSRDAIDDTENNLDSHLDLIHLAILEEFPQIPEKEVNTFFDNFDQNRVFILKPDVYDKVVSDWLGIKTSSNGQYEPYSSVIFVSNNNEKSFNTLTEEVIHAMLLDQVPKTRLSLTKDIVTGSLDLLHLWKHRNNNDYIEMKLEEKYLTDPNEQIAKAVKRKVLNNLNKTTLHTFTGIEGMCADMGEKRIQELGWENIFKGIVTTNHEQDFLVNQKMYDVLQKERKLHHFRQRKIHEKQYQAFLERKRQDSVS